MEPEDEIYMWDRLVAEDDQLVSSMSVKNMLELSTLMTNETGVDVTLPIDSRSGDSFIISHAELKSQEDYDKLYEEHEELKARYNELLKRLNTQPPKRSIKGQHDD